MTDSTVSLRIRGLKAQAKKLRARLAAEGTAISHGKALEMIAHQQGARDWNTLCALAARPGNNRPLAVGDRVSGRYLGQAFSGCVHGLSRTAHAPYQCITLHFDEAVDVVTFESFSAFRQRVSAVIGEDGRSLYRTSSGDPQLVVTHEGL